MNLTYDRQTKNWADEDSAPVVTDNGDGTKTVVFYRVNPETKKKVRVTQKVREVKVTEKVNHSVAERRKWAKYGLEKGRGPGPNVVTTSVGENIGLKLSLKSLSSKETEKKADPVIEEPVGKPGVVCRTCGGDHFTLKCPYKGVLGNDDAAEPVNDPLLNPLAGGSGIGGSGSYVPPHLRNRTGGLSDPGRIAPMERDDSRTLRVSNLSDMVNEDDLRSIFGRFGKILRCHLVRDRETGRSRGFAFISYDLLRDAEAACARLDKKSLDNLIMRVEFSQKERQ